MIETIRLSWSQRAKVGLCYLAALACAVIAVLMWFVYHYGFMVTYTVLAGSWVVVGAGWRSKMLDRNAAELARRANTDWIR